MGTGKFPLSLKGKRLPLAMEGREACKGPVGCRFSVSRGEDGNKRVKDAHTT